MEETKYLNCCKMALTEKCALYTEDKDTVQDFIAFLRYCSGRLNKGDSVQAIWRDFQEKAL